MKKAAHFIGIDVGTGSARAGIFDGSGRMAGQASQRIRMWKPQADFVEQSSEDIWQACGRAVRMALEQSGLAASDVAGIGFDATCSLVAIDAEARPVSLSPTGRDEQNVIVWMDHRAMAQTARINGTKHAVLRYVGGVISPEMQTPKLLWIKAHLPRAWKRTALFFDLPDYLTFRATGDETRSLCSTVCKWTYRGDQGWDETYFQEIGLGDLAQGGFRKIGARVRPMGEALGQGLTAKSAEELGLEPGTAVGVSIIDAHAGGLGMLGAPLRGKKVTVAQLEKRLALIGGTSSCHMAVSKQPRFIRGIWGPYFSAMIPGLWLTEGGQSATGALVDHVIFSHAAAGELETAAKAEGKSVYELLNRRLEAMAKSESCRFQAELTRDFHLQPDYHGNRSPRANATLKGMIAGLTLSATLDDLAREYLAAIQAVAHGTRHILEEMNRKGNGIKALFVCGGGLKNPVFLREHADITGCELIMPREPEAVLLGSAVLGAVAARTYSPILEAMNAMNACEKIIVPSQATKAYHDRKYRVFHRMHTDFLAYRRIMQRGGKEMAL